VEWGRKWKRGPGAHNHSVRTRSSRQHGLQNKQYWGWPAWEVSRDGGEVQLRVQIIQRIMQPMVGVMGWEGYSVLTLYHKGSYSNPQFSSVQLLNRVWLFVTPWNAARQASLSITNSQSSLTLMSIESVMPSSHLIFCHPLLLPPSIPPSIRVFSNESVPCIRWTNYWSFRLSISPSNEYSGLISFRMDWLDLLAVQGTLKSLLQHHS